MPRLTFTTILLLTIPVSVAGQGAEAKAKAHADKAAKLAADGKHAEAVAELDRAIELQPGNAKYKLECGRVMILAVTAGKRAAKVEPTIDDYLPALKMLSAAGDLDKSLRAYVFLYAADAGIAYRNLAGARKSLQAALDAAPNDRTIKAEVDKRLAEIGR